MRCCLFISPNCVIDTVCSLCRRRSNSVGLFETAWPSAWAICVAELEFRTSSSSSRPLSGHRRTRSSHCWQQDRGTPIAPRRLRSKCRLPPLLPKPLAMRHTNTKSERARRWYPRQLWASELGARICTVEPQFRLYRVCMLSLSNCLVATTASISRRQGQHRG